MLLCLSRKLEKKASLCDFPRKKFKSDDNVKTSLPVPQAEISFGESSLNKVKRGDENIEDSDDEEHKVVQPLVPHEDMNTLGFKNALARSRGNTSLLLEKEKRPIQFKMSQITSPAPSTPIQTGKAQRNIQLFVSPR